MERLCVYCGSRAGRSPAYGDAVTAFGRELVRRDVDLVYGAGGVGLMGTLARTVLDAGGAVIGVIPEDLQSSERPPDDLTELRTVDSMHARKRAMFELSEGFVALPGGLGTLDELFEMLTWSQLGIHDYPCGILDVESYYDGIAGWLDHAVREGFVDEDHRRSVLVADDPVGLLDAMEDYDPPQTGGDLDPDAV